MENKNWAERFADHVRRLPVLVLLLLLSAIIAATGTVVGAAQCTWNAYDNHFNWRQHEYEKISELRAGISIERFREVLGSPLFVRASRDGSFAESTFRGRSYWIQAVHDTSGSVLLFSVTSCDEDFRPTFQIPNGRSRFGVTLNGMSLADVPETPYEVRYFVSGATANSYFYDVYGFGNPGLYKTYYVGVDDACPTRALDQQALVQGLTFFRSKSTPLPYGAVRPDQTPIPDSDMKAIQEFRQGSVPNTYAEDFFFSEGHAGRITLDDILAEFQIGADRLLIRTVP